MKVYDIISEEVVNEKPMGMLKRAGLGIASKLGSAGAKAKLDVGTDANAMKKDLATWMAGSGIAKGQLQPDELINFLGQKGLPTGFVDKTLQGIRQAGGTPDEAPLSNPEVDELLKKAVQSGFKSQGAGGRKSKFAQPDVPQMPPMRGGVDPKLKAAMDQLKAAGYKVTK